MWLVRTDEVGWDRLSVRTNANTPHRGQQLQVVHRAGPAGRPARSPPTCDGPAHPVAQRVGVHGEPRSPRPARRPSASSQASTDRDKVRSGARGRRRRGGPQPGRAGRGARRSSPGSGEQHLGAEVAEHGHVGVRRPSRRAPGRPRARDVGNAGQPCHRRADARPAPATPVRRRAVATTSAHMATRAGSARSAARSAARRTRGRRRRRSAQRGGSVAACTATTSVELGRGRARGWSCRRVGPHGEPDDDGRASPSSPNVPATSVSADPPVEQPGDQVRVQRAPGPAGCGAGRGARRPPGPPRRSTSVRALGERSGALLHPDRAQLALARRGCRPPAGAGSPARRARRRARRPRRRAAGRTPPTRAASAGSPVGPGGRGWTAGAARRPGRVAVGARVGQHPARGVLDADDAPGEQRRPSGPARTGRRERPRPAAPVVEHVAGQRLQALPAHVRPHREQRRSPASGRRRAARRRPAAFTATAAAPAPRQRAHEPVRLAAARPDESTSWPG